MPLSAELREQLLTGFRAELAEHIQTMTDGLLALEQGRVLPFELQGLLEELFRAAHSAKGTARALGVSDVETLAHALEDVWAAIQQQRVTPDRALYAACYGALDALQAAQGAFDAQAGTPAQLETAMQALLPFRGGREEGTALAEAAERAAQDGHDAPPAASETRAAFDAPFDLSAAVPGSAAALVVAAPAAVIAAPAPAIAAPTAAPARAATGNGAPAAAGAPAPSRPGEDTLRVSAQKLDALLTEVGELLVARIRAEQRLEKMRQVQGEIAQWQKEWAKVRGSYGSLARQLRPQRSNTAGRLDPRAQHTLQLLSYVGAGQERLRRLYLQMGELSREGVNDMLQLSLAIDAIEEEVKRVRMLPLSRITGPFARMVRDMAQSAGKEAVLVIAGGEVELDKRVLEQIKDPLIHILRNAVDHGVETPERRLAAGKARGGSIVLRAEQLGQDVVLSVSDDGAGLDVEAIRRAAARRGIDSAGLRPDELVELIFRPGITTAPMITDVSGRGVGLDVVRRNVESLRGRIAVDWTAGRGTAITLTLPVTLSNMRGLLVRVGDERFAIALSSIERILRLTPQQISSLEGFDTLLYDGRPLTLVRLHDVLGLPHAAARPDGRLRVVVLAAAERRMAFVIDELLGEQEFVVKGLGKQVTRLGGIAGASLLGSGEVVLILNVADLIKLALRGGHRSVLDTAEPGAAPAGPAERRRILIVDDSITTRTLEKNILEAAGYAVQLATDGQEALDVIAAGGLPDLIISDVSMPRIDGFLLTRQLKGSEQTAAVPIILVTSLGTSADKTRGLQAGADAYLIKSSFDQNNLLDTIEQLI